MLAATAILAGFGRKLFQLDIDSRPAESAQEPLAAHWYPRYHHLNPKSR
jgi:hypothetical protein